MQQSLSTGDLAAPVAPVLTSGLGNRLFQFAAASAAAALWRRPLTFSLPNCRECPHGPLASIFRMFPQIPVEDTPRTWTEYKEPARKHYEYFPFEAESPPPPHAPILIHGFRQNPRYLAALGPGGLTPNWNSALGGLPVRHWLEKDSGLWDPQEQARTVSLHVRLGDYRRLAHHQQDLTHYWARALELVPRGARLHLFSDEPDLCKGQFVGWAARHGVHFTVARIRSDVESLYEMSLCRGGNITANSTFSWWAAYFAHQAGSAWATYPNKWGAGMPDARGIVPDWGTLIEVD